jgi:hypothetical protein
VVKASLAACLLLSYSTFVFWFSSRKLLEVVGQPRGFVFQGPSRRLGRRESMLVSTHSLLCAVVSVCSRHTRRLPRTVFLPACSLTHGRVSSDFLGLVMCLCVLVC